MSREEIERKWNEAESFAEQLGLVLLCDPELYPEDMAVTLTAHDTVRLACAAMAWIRDTEGDDAPSITELLSMASDAECFYEYVDGMMVRPPFRYWREVGDVEQELTTELVVKWAAAAGVGDTP